MVVVYVEKQILPPVYSPKDNPKKAIESLRRKKIVNECQNDLKNSLTMLFDFFILVYHITTIMKSKGCHYIVLL